LLEARPAYHLSVAATTGHGAFVSVAAHVLHSAKAARVMAITAIFMTTPPQK